MKKNLIFYLIGVLCLFVSSCNGCKQKEVIEKNDSVLTVGMVDHFIAVDRQSMFAEADGDYLWFETQLEFKNYFDEESDKNLDNVVNIFQVITEYDQGADVVVYTFSHSVDSTEIIPKDGFWVEDQPLNNDTIKLSFEQAYERMMAANAPKPHSKAAVLRKPVGIYDCNPQYIFGNVYYQLWVDAVTGDVKDSNPAFSNTLAIPLGEWP